MKLGWLQWQLKFRISPPNPKKKFEQHKNCKKLWGRKEHWTSRSKWASDLLNDLGRQNGCNGSYRQKSKAKHTHLESLIKLSCFRHELQHNIPILVNLLPSKEYVHHISVTNIAKPDVPESLPQCTANKSPFWLAGQFYCLSVSISDHSTKTHSVEGSIFNKPQQAPRLTNGYPMEGCRTKLAHKYTRSG